MSESLEIIYYGKGFSKGKNGTQRAMSGITIGRGEPKKALLSSLTALNGLGSDIDAWLLEWCVHNELHRFHNLTLTEAIENVKKKL